MPAKYYRKPKYYRNFDFIFHTYTFSYYVHSVQFCTFKFPIKSQIGTFNCLNPYPIIINLSFNLRS